MTDEFFLMQSIPLHVYVVIYASCDDVTESDSE